MHRTVANVATPVTFHLITMSLDVTKPTGGVALPVVGMPTVTSHVSLISTPITAHFLASSSTPAASAATTTINAATATTTINAATTTINAATTTLTSGAMLGLLVSK
ncbi:hypothetical protein CesoFtcFv8_013702 [Champsocephalus esox]|uniref:Uncharacterized protein n=1 Tax=Champsocephalus esox TaxID=159716 RepID=A0AAN8BU00_9TELE|nr:hypothetical protein CesoFtcFv8_013702 [Champsocephalus esox]